MDKRMWGAIIDDMRSSGMPDAEIKESLQRRYPERNDLVEMLTTNIALPASIKGFCKKGQDFGFGMGNEYQSNFSIPNSEGETGSGTGTDIDGFEPAGSSYTDRLRMRKQLKDDEKKKELKEQRKELQQAARDESYGKPRPPRDRKPDEPWEQPANWWKQEEAPEEPILPGVGTAAHAQAGVDTVQRLLDKHLAKPIPTDPEGKAQWERTKRGLEGHVARWKEILKDLTLSDEDMGEMFKFDRLKGFCKKATKPGEFLEGKTPKRPGAKEKRYFEQLYEDKATEIQEAHEVKQTAPVGVSKEQEEDHQKAQDTNDKTQETLKKTKDQATDTAKEVEQVTSDTEKAVESLERAVTDLLG